MNEILMRIVVDFAVLLEVSDASRVDADLAVQQLEYLSFMLKQLSPTEQSCLRTFIERLASEPGGRGSKSAEERRRCLEQLPDAMGLVDV